jgi:SOS-response transcriptional repressor LexA
MNAQSLIETLSEKGVRLIPDGDGLVVEPASRLTDAEREAIRAHKAELLQQLAAGQPCEHVKDDPELAEWYRENPHLTCARCFFAGRPLRAMLQ